MYRKYGKRAIDLLFGFCMLVPAIVITVIVAILTKLTDGGPVFFSQERAGRNGIPFRFYKFRSMPVGIGNVPSDQLEALKLPVFFRFLRRSNLDEIPQIYNIMNGDMSIIGPRPCLLSQTELIALRRQNGAILCLPGLTGYAQVNSFDGMSVEQKAHLDYLYYSDVTMFRDLMVLLNTLKYLMKPPPKY